jgi:hypothetical protein
MNASQPIKRNDEHMHIRAGEILISQDGQYYRVLEVTDHCISLMRVSGQTIFACRPDYLANVFSLATAQAPPSQALPL